MIATVLLSFLMGYVVVGLVCMALAVDGADVRERLVKDLLVGCVSLVVVVALWPLAFIGD